METSLIPDDDVGGVGMAGADLAKEGVAHDQTDAIGERGFRQTIAGYLKRGLKDSPIGNVCGGAQWGGAPVKSTLGARH
jgi:hypothetical protein